MSREKGTAVFDQVAQSYDELHRASIGASGETPDYFHDQKVKLVLEAGCRTDEPLLDYGCGIGNLLSRFENSFVDVHGYDPSQASLEIAKRVAPRSRFYDEVDRKSVV